MATVIAALSMSLGGFVADPADQVGPLLDWYGNGEVAVPTANPQLTFRTSQASAHYLREAIERAGAVVAGRRLFDVAGGWGGTHPWGCRCSWSPISSTACSARIGRPRDEQDDPTSLAAEALMKIAELIERATRSWGARLPRADK
jgi:hypothetical protein